MTTFEDLLNGFAEDIKELIDGEFENWEEFKDNLIKEYLGGKYE